MDRTADFYLEMATVLDEDANSLRDGVVAMLGESSIAAESDVKVVALRTQAAVCREKAKEVQLHGV